LKFLAYNFYLLLSFLHQELSRDVSILFPFLLLKLKQIERN